MSVMFVTLRIRTDVSYNVYDIGSVARVIRNEISRCSIPAPDPVFPPHFLRIEVEVIVTGQPHVLRLCLGLIKGMLPIRCYRSTKPLFVSIKFNGDHVTG